MTPEIRTLALYQAAEFRSDMMRLGVAAMLGSETASKALATATADACIEHALHPERTGVAERYAATVAATVLACMSGNPAPCWDADLPAVGSFHG